jgi:hypothetical protein
MGKPVACLQRGMNKASDVPRFETPTTWPAHDDRSFDFLGNFWGKRAVPLFKMSRPARSQHVRGRLNSGYPSKSEMSRSDVLMDDRLGVWPLERNANGRCQAKFDARIP